MSGHLKVKNWDSFQHYKDRSPPWIKLHRDLLRDYEFSCLQDASKLHLVLIWLLASQLDNKIPNDPAWIQRQIGTEKPPNVKELIHIGFLCLVQDASKPLAERKQTAIVETETEAYKEETETQQHLGDGDKSPPAPQVISIPLVDKTEYGITEDQVSEWIEAYPAIDVPQELRQIRQWNLANPKNQKTRAGVLRHVTAWLSKAQNRAPTGATNGRGRQDSKQSVADRASEVAERRLRELAEQLRPS